MFVAKLIVAVSVSNAWTEFSGPIKPFCNNSSNVEWWLLSIVFLMRCNCGQIISLMKPVGEAWAQSNYWSPVLDYNLTTLSFSDGCPSYESDTDRKLNRECDVAIPSAKRARAKWKKISYEELQRYFSHGITYCGIAELCDGDSPLSTKFRWDGWKIKVVFDKRNS